MSHEAATLPHELPGPLPRGERILWQSAPEWTSLFRTAFHGQGLSIYFVAMLLLRGAVVLSDGGGWIKAIDAILWLTPLVLLALGIVATISYFAAKQSYYTITDARLVMRIGIVLEITFNFPFRAIESVGLRLNADGTGDLPLNLIGDDRIAYAHLWPHVRPWQFSKTQPMLRAVPNAQEVAELLSRAMVASTGGTAHATVSISKPPRRHKPETEVTGTGVATAPR